jgi:hypothetical protein
MWQNLLRHCAVLTKVSEEFAPHYLAEIRHDMRQTTLTPLSQEMFGKLVDECAVLETQLAYD